MDKQSNWRELDVFRDAKYDNLVKRFCLTKSNATSSQEMVFKTIKEFMVFAALVGFELDLFDPIEQGVKKIPISLGTYCNTQHDVYIYLMALSRKPELDTLRNDNMHESIKIFEGYCNGGLRHINDWVLSSIGDNLGAETLFNNTFEFLTEKKQQHL